MSTLCPRSTVVADANRLCRVSVKQIFMQTLTSRWEVWFHLLEEDQKNNHLSTALLEANSIHMNRIPESWGPRCFRDKQTRRVPLLEEQNKQMRQHSRTGCPMLSCCKLKANVSMCPRKCPWPNNTRVWLCKAVISCCLFNEEKVITHVPIWIWWNDQLPQHQHWLDPWQRNCNTTVQRSTATLINVSDLLGFSYHS